MDTTTRKQQTIAANATVTGFGYWTGHDVRVEFRPAAADTGIVFVRSDLPGNPRIPATVAHRVEVPRRTSLRAGAANVDMIEHITAALHGLRIDNCEVWIDQPEAPGLDGSALAFVEALDQAGVVEQDASRLCRIVNEIIRLGDEECWVEARPARRMATIVRYQLDYGPGSPIGRQSYELSLTPAAFRNNLAPCRTFMLKAEADWLLAQGLGNRATARDLLVFDNDGPIDNPTRFPNECARHKALDLVGDLALAQCDLIGQFVAYRSGHRLNAELVRALQTEARMICPLRRCA
jgi:UDP-3-O-acyl N-acetylglucosamine deacetylase